MTQRIVSPPDPNVTVDSAVAAVFAAFPGDTWRQAALREVIEAALGLTAHEVELVRCRYCLQAWPADLLDEDSSGCLTCEVASPFDGA